mmetsp:Transcript_19602/g.41326  ORF Transcript_19602/g.41326 Transcript_19602/m.41326 type:complete len:280 (+) Transcript_19602:42-881(+)
MLSPSSLLVIELSDALLLSMYLCPILSLHSPDGGVDRGADRVCSLSSLVFVVRGRVTGLVVSVDGVLLVLDLDLELGPDFFSRVAVGLPPGLLGLLLALPLLLLLLVQPVREDRLRHLHLLRHERARLLDAVLQRPLQHLRQRPVQQLLDPHFWLHRHLLHHLLLFHLALLLHRLLLLHALEHHLHLPPRQLLGLLLRLAGLGRRRGLVRLRVLAHAVLQVLHLVLNHLALVLILQPEGLVRKTLVPLLLLRLLARLLRLSAAALLLPHLAAWLGLTAG